MKNQQIEALRAAVAALRKGSLEANLVFAGINPMEAESFAKDILARAQGFLEEVEAGHRRVPDYPPAYLRRMADNAIIDHHREDDYVPLSDSDQALVGNALYSGSHQEGEEDGGWIHGVSKPKLRKSRPTGVPRLLQTLRSVARGTFPGMREANLSWHIEIEDTSYANSAIDDWDARLRQLPTRAQQAAQWYLWGVRQADIARRMGDSRGRVTQLLGDACNALRLDRRGLGAERYRLLIANLVVIATGALRPFEPEVTDAYWAERDRESKADPWGEIRRKKEEEKWKKGRPGGWTSITEWYGQSPQQAGQAVNDPLAQTLRQAKEQAVYRAVISAPELEAWAEGLRPEHAVNIIDFVRGDWY